MTTDETARPERSARETAIANAALHVRHNLMLVQSGQRSRAPGIRKCGDCREHFIDDHTGLTVCPDCRPHHSRHCADCGQPFRNTEAGDRLCECCREQLSLFDTGRSL